MKSEGKVSGYTHRRAHTLRLGGTFHLLRQHNASLCWHRERIRVRGEVHGGINARYKGLPVEGRPCGRIHRAEDSSRELQHLTTLERRDINPGPNKSRTSSEVNNHSAISKAAFLYWRHCRSDNVANICFMRTYSRSYQERLGLSPMLHRRTACETMQSNDNGGCFVKYASGGGWWCEINPTAEKCQPVDNS